MLINIVGPDGSGKTTQLELLDGWLPTATALPHRFLTKADIFDTERFPECEFLGCEYSFMAHAQLPIMQGASRAMCLYFMLTLNVTRHPPLADEVVIADGYWHKHWATEKALGLPDEWLTALGSQMPEPELTLCLDMSAERIVARGRTRHPYESGLDMQARPESFIAHQTRVRANMLEMAARRDWVVINADRDAQAVQSDLQQHIREALAAPPA